VRLVDKGIIEEMKRGRGLKACCLKAVPSKNVPDLGPCFCRLRVLGRKETGRQLPRMKVYSVCGQHIVVVGFVCVGRSKGRTLETSCT
jgi:hypothetical protein